MRHASALLLAACAPAVAPSPPTDDVAARVVGGASLIELRANADVLDDDAWTQAIADAADSAIACLGLPRDRVLHRYARIPLLYARLSSSELQAAAGCAAIARVGPDLQDFAAVDVVLDLVGAEGAWAASAADGSGVAIGVVDSGVRVTEPDLAGRVVFAYDHAEGDDDATDCSGHGSNVAAIAGAVAPGADLLVHKVMSIDRNNCGSALHSHTALALDALLGQRATHRLAVVNLSIAGSVRYATACDGDIVGYTAGVRALRDAGVAVVAAAGNNGDPEGASYPACLTTTIAVANSVKAPLEDFVTDDIWRNSNGGPLIDLAAPGTRVVAGGSTRTGTSMSAPAVAGAVAVLASIDAAIGPEAVRERLRASPIEVVDARGSEVRRFPRLHLPSALEAARPVATARVVDDGTDGTAGDGDARAEDGETVSVRFSAPGSGAWSGVTARLTCDDPGLSVTRAEIALGDVAFPIDGAAMTTGFLVAIDAGCDERAVACGLSLTDARDLSRHFALALPILCQDDRDGDGFPFDVDCDDDDPLRHPGAAERCNGLDDDCDGVPDNGLLEPWAPDGDGDGFGGVDTQMLCAAPSPGWLPVAERPADDCDDADPSVHPGAAERCNGRDDDCNGLIDDGAGDLWWPDGDGDGWGAGAPVSACERPAGHAGRDGDCDDGDAAVFPDDEGVCPQPGGCACDAGAAPGFGVALLLPLLVARRRSGRRVLGGS